MTQDKIKEVTEIMSQMDLKLQEYAIDMLRHLRFAQITLQNQDNCTTQPEATKTA